MKLKHILRSISTDGGKYQETHTVIDADLVNVEGGHVVTGQLKLRIPGNHYALFMNYADLHVTPSAPFDIPLPEPKPAQPKTDAERAAEALDRAAMAICKGDKYGEALLAVNTARDILRAPTPLPQFRIVTLSCGHDVWAHPHLKLGDFAPCEQHPASRIVAIR